MLTALFACSFFYIGLRAFQQLSVIHNRLFLIPPVSYLMAFFEVAIITQIVTTEDPMLHVVFALGTGSWCGCLASMWLHKRIRSPKDTHP